MQKLLFLFLASPILALSAGSEALFNRLSKLYAEDPNQCMIAAKREIQHAPNKPVPYYFVSKLFLKKVDRSANSRGKYMNMRRSVFYAIQFNKLSTTSIQELVKWDDHLVAMSSIRNKVSKELSEDGNTDLIVLLDEKFKALENQEDLMANQMDEIVERSASPSLSKEVDIETKVDVSNSTEFFGMPSGNENVASFNVSSEKQLLALINAERKKQGMEPLVWQEDLARAARYHAYDMATQNYFNHSSYDKRGGELEQVGGTFERIRKFYSGSFVNSENIAAGNRKPEDTYRQWYNSPGHYANMFNGSSKKVGIGVVHAPNSTYGYYWVFCTAR
jgi:uncharacterized protein YkwD